MSRWPFYTLRFCTPSEAEPASPNNPFPATPITAAEWHEIKSHALKASEDSVAFARLFAAMCTAEDQAEEVNNLFRATEALTTARNGAHWQDLIPPSPEEAQTEGA